MDFLTSNKKVALWVVIPSVVLLLIYTLLSYLAFSNPGFWYESMGIPQPEHGFLLISWGGKNTAMVVSLLLALISRQRLPLAIAMAVLFTGQMGDTLAGAQTGVDVFVTYIALAFVVIQVALLYIPSRRDVVAGA